MSEQFHFVTAQADFPAEGKLAVTIAGWHILICSIEGAFHAVNDRCTHAASPLSTGRIRRGTVMCPLHGARFDVASGKCVGGDYAPLRTFALRTENGEINVEIPAHMPGREDLPLGA